MGLSFVTAGLPFLSCQDAWQAWSSNRAGSQAPTAGAGEEVWHECSEEANPHSEEGVSAARRLLPDLDDAEGELVDEDDWQEALEEPCLGSCTCVSPSTAEALSGRVAAACPCSKR